MNNTTHTYETDLLLKSDIVQPVSLLLDIGSNIDIRDWKGKSAIFFASSRGNLDIVCTHSAESSMYVGNNHKAKVLLDKKPKLNMKVYSDTGEKSETALHIAGLYYLVHNFSAMFKLVSQKRPYGYCISSYSAWS